VSAPFNATPQPPRCRAPCVCVGALALLNLGPLATLWALLRQQPRARHLVYRWRLRRLWRALRRDCIPARSTCLLPGFPRFFIFETLYRRWTCAGCGVASRAAYQAAMVRYEVSSADPRVQLFCCTARSAVTGTPGISPMKDRRCVCIAGYQQKLSDTVARLEATPGPALKGPLVDRLLAACHIAPDVAAGLWRVAAGPTAR